MTNTFQLEDKVEEGQYGKLVRRIWPYAKKYKGLLILTVSLVIVHTAAGRVLPWLLGYAIDHVIIPKNLELVLPVVFGYLGLEILRFIFTVLESYLFQVLGHRVIYDLRSDLYKHIHKLPLSYFDRTPVGRLVTRITNDFASLSDLFTAGLVSVFTDSLALIAIVVAMGFIDLKLTAIVLVIAPFMIALSFWMSAQIRKILRRVKKQIANMNSFVSENINGMKVVQLYVREKLQMARFDDLNQDYKRLQMKNIQLMAILQPLLFIFNALTVAAALYYGGILTIDKGLAVGSLVAFLTHVQDFLPPLRNIVEKYQTFQASLASAERIFTIMDQMPEILDGKPVNMGRLLGHIEFRNVTFRYNDDLEPALDNVSFEILPGQSIAFVGATGSGKSTIISLIQRLYEITSGTITVDGMDISTLDKRDLRSRIGVVQQDFFTFKGTIGSNISLKNPKISADQIRMAGSKANCEELIRRHGGIDGEVQERGGNLSSGEKQLINFARIIAYNPDILILDEATAHIDSQSEKLIQEAISEITKGRTSIIIAHRLSTITQCDKIIVLDKGKIIESGNHSELLARGGHYSNYFMLQLQGEGQDRSKEF